MMGVALTSGMIASIPHTSHTHALLAPRMHSPARVQVRQLSRLYASAPAYVTDQPPFLNAAALVDTALQPLDLLRSLTQIEVGGLAGATSSRGTVVRAGGRQRSQAC